MNLPFFYIDVYDGSKTLLLNEETSKHVVQVLRMQEGEKLNLTDGKGSLLTCEISDAHKKHCSVTVIETRNLKPVTPNVSIAISLLKNANRFEWFLEKATEIGVREIIPLICQRTEKEKFRQDRLQSICTSAMLQSQQCWLPRLHEPVSFADLVIQQFEQYQKYIAHCEDGVKNPLSNQHLPSSSHHLIMIGPEGDFTPAEIQHALQYGFQPVSLGATRLRTETAGVVAATILVMQ